MNDEITKVTSDHKRRQWRELVESIDHRTDSTMLWRTIKGIDGKSKQTEENEGITFAGNPYTSPKLIANNFKRQFTTSKLGKHSSSMRTRQVWKDVKRMLLLFAMIRSVVKSFKVPDVVVAAARMSNESACTRHQKTLVRLDAGPGWMS